MVGAENSEEAVFLLKLFVDKNKNKVVLVESGKEFVDVLFSFLTLPMGTIVRLMEKYQKNQVSEATKIGCFNNLYRSVLDIGTTNFMTEACKDMLLYPRSLKDNQRKLLKINIDDTETLKYYTCPNQCPFRFYSNFSSSKCNCGTLMTREIELHGGVEDEEIFVSEETLFIITDNLKVGFFSVNLTLKTLDELGYYNFDQIYQIDVYVNHEKVIDLLQCLFSSDTPFTDVFLTDKRSLTIPNLSVQEEFGGVAQSNKVISVRVFTRKLDKKVIYIESEKDFVDLLFTFLVLPLNSAWNLAGNHLGLGCVDNLCESFKSLSNVRVTNPLNNNYIPPWFQQPLLDVCYGQYWNITATVNSYPCTLYPIDPTCDKPPEAGVCNGFVKSDTTFMVSDDLTITPMDLSSTICSLKKWSLDLDDTEMHVINITKAEAIKLLRASFVTTNALSTVFHSLL